MINEDKDTQSDAPRTFTITHYIFDIFYTGIVAAYTETNNRCSKQCPFTFRGNVTNDTILVTTLSGFDT